MPIGQTKAQPKPTFKTPSRSKPIPKRDVILAPDLFEAVLESVQQAKDGKTLSHEEVKRRNQP